MFRALSLFSKQAVSPNVSISVEKADVATLIMATPALFAGG
jgi:hypothetical protein